MHEIVVNFKGVETESAVDKPPRQNLLSLINELLTKGVVASSLLKERLELDILEGLGLANRKAFEKKTIKLNVAERFKCSIISTLKKKACLIKKYLFSVTKQRDSLDL